jgi:aldehyde:ferredoxin oxidoreductase
LTKKDTDELKLEWGDTGVILELIRKMAYRQGFGDILAEGSAQAADIIGKGSSYYAMHIKRMDIYEVLRGAIAWALGTTTSTRGGGHTTGSPLIETYIVTDPRLPQKAKEVYGIETANHATAYEGKAKLTEFFECMHRVNNSLGICHFNTIWTNPWHPGFPEMAELYSAATGWETSEDDLRRITRKQLNLEKAFNLLRTNLDRKDDYPTQRALNEPIPSGRVAGWKMEKSDWDKLLDDYYELHGWDKETSYPTRKCLEDLDLKDVADDLERIGKLGRGK